MATHSKATAQEHSQAESVATKVVEDFKTHDFEQALRKDIVEQSLKSLGAAPARLEAPKPLTAAAAKDAQSKTQEALGSVAFVRHELVANGPRESYVTWDTQAEKSQRVLVVRTNVDHPFYRALPPSGHKWYYAFIIAECFAEFMQREVGYESLALVKNTLLATHGARLLKDPALVGDEFKTKL